MDDNQVVESKRSGGFIAGLVVGALVLAVIGLLLVRMLKEDDTPVVGALRISEH